MGRSFFHSEKSRGFFCVVCLSFCLIGAGAFAWDATYTGGASPALEISGSGDWSSVTLTLSGGNVQVNGADPSGGPCPANTLESLTIDAAPNSLPAPNFNLDLTALNPTNLPALSGPVSISLDGLLMAAATVVELQGSDLDDEFSPGNMTVPFTFYGNGGEDTLDGLLCTIGFTVYGGEGDDNVTLGTGHDTVYGEGGDDFFTLNIGEDEVDGGMGNDTYLAQDWILNTNDYFTTLKDLNLDSYGTSDTLRIHSTDPFTGILGTGADYCFALGGWHNEVYYVVVEMTEKIERVIVEGPNFPAYYYDKGDSLHLRPGGVLEHCGYDHTYPEGEGIIFQNVMNFSGLTSDYAGSHHSYLYVHDGALFGRVDGAMGYEVIDYGDYSSTLSLNLGLLLPGFSTPCTNIKTIIGSKGTDRFDLTGVDYDTAEANHWVRDVRDEIYLMDHSLYLDGSENQLEIHNLQVPLPDLNLVSFEDIQFSSQTECLNFLTGRPFQGTIDGGPNTTDRVDFDGRCSSMNLQTGACDLVTSGLFHFNKFQELGELTLQDEPLSVSLTNQARIQWTASGEPYEAYRFSTLRLGDQDDTFILVNSAQMEAHLYGGGGVNTLEMQNRDGLLVDLSNNSCNRFDSFHDFTRILGDWHGVEEVTLPAGDHHWNIDGSGMAEGDYFFSDIDRFVFQDGADYLDFGPGFQLPALMKLGGGGDQMDFADIADPIEVNLNHKLLRHKGSSVILEDPENLSTLTLSSQADRLLAAEADTALMPLAGADFAQGLKKGVAFDLDDGGHKMASSDFHPLNAFAAPGSTEDWSLTESQKGRMTALAETTSFQAEPERAALSFDGSDDYMELESAALALTENVTIEWRAMVRDTSQSGPFLAWEGLGATEADNTLYALSWDSSGKILYSWQYGAGSSASLQWDMDLTPGRWMDFALVRNDSSRNVTLYVNGISLGTQGYANSPTGGSSGKLYLGGRPRSAQYIKGAVADVMIWSGARSMAVVRSDFAQTPDPGASMLELWLPLSERMGKALDFSPNQALGVLKNGCGREDGFLGRRTLWLDGVDDGATADSETAFDGTGAFTVSGWFRVDAFNGAYQTLAAKGNAWDLSRENETDHLRFSVAGLSPATVQCPFVDVNNGFYHHVAGVYDGSELRLYVDGKLEGQAAVSGTRSQNDFPFTLGTNGETAGRNFSGRLADWSYWNRALTPTELGRLMKESPDAGAAGLVAAYPFGAVDCQSGAYAGQRRLANLATGGPGMEVSGGLGVNQWPRRIAGRNAVMEFDGFYDRMLPSNADALRLTDDVTLEMWVLWNSTNTVDRQLYMFGADGETEADNVLLEVRLTGDYIGGYGRMDLMVAHEYGAGSNVNFTFNFNLPRYTWVHLSVVREVNPSGSSYYRLYRNGVRVNEYAFDSSKNPTGGSNGEPLFGAHYDSGDPRFLMGGLDDIRVWNRPLAGNEIRGNLSRHLSGLEPGLVSWWPILGEEPDNKTFWDYSLTGNDATQYADCKWTQTRYRSNLRLSGSGQYVSVGQSSALSLNEDMSFSCWLRPEDFTDSARIVHQADHLFGVQLEPGGFVQVFHKDDLSGVDVSHNFTHDPLVVNEWVHLALTRDATQTGGLYTLYLDGEEADSWAYTGLVKSDALLGGMDLGVREDLGGYFYVGSIADVGLWDCALSPTYIRLTRDVRLKGHEKHLVAYWPMDGATGDQMEDLGPSGLDATLYGSPEWADNDLAFYLKPALEAQLGSGEDIYTASDLPDHWYFPDSNTAQGTAVLLEGIDGLVAGDGDDTFRFASGHILPALLDGGGGFNALDFSAWVTGISVDLTGGTATNCADVQNFNDITGGLSNDMLRGDSSNNVLTGLDGNDTFAFADNWGVDEVVEEAAAGRDVLDFSAVTQNIYLDLGTMEWASGVNEVIDRNLRTEETVLGSGDDTVRVVSFPVYASGTGGLDGGPGRDTLDYSDYVGQVTVNLAEGEATGLGHARNFESIIGNNVNNTYTLGPGDGTIVGGWANDTYYLEDNWGSMTLVDQGGLDALDCSAVTKDLTFNVAEDWIVLSDGISTLTFINSAAGGYNPIEIIKAGQGDDVFVFTSEFSRIAFGAGEVYGGNGSDTLDYSTFVTSITLDLTTGFALNSGAVHTIENVIGGFANDNISGNGEANILVGGPGDDNLAGLDGDDTYLFADNWGEDTIVETLAGFGSGGFDTLDFSGVTTRSLNINTSNIQITDGVNMVNYSAGTLEGFRGGQADDNFTVAASTENGLLLDGSQGSDSYSITLTGTLLGRTEVQDTGTDITTDSMTVTGTAENENWQVSPRTIIRRTALTTETLRYDPNIEALVVYALAGDDSFDPVNNSTGTNITLDGGAHVPVVGGDSLLHVKTTEARDHQVTVPGSAGYIDEEGMARLNYVNVETINYADPPTEHDTGNVHVVAGAVINFGDNLYEAQREVTLDSILITTGPVLLDDGEVEITGDGPLVMENVPDLGDLTLMQGAYSIDADYDTDLSRVISTVPSGAHVDFYGVPMGIYQCDFNESAVWINGWFESGGVQVPFTGLKIDPILGAEFVNGQWTLGDNNVFDLADASFSQDVLQADNLSLNGPANLDSFTLTQVVLTPSGPQLSGGAFQRGPIQYGFTAANSSLDDVDGLVLNTAESTAGFYGSATATLDYLQMGNASLSVDTGSLDVNGFHLPFYTQPQMTDNGLTVAETLLDFATGRDITNLTNLSATDAAITLEGGQLWVDLDLLTFQNWDYDAGTGCFNIDQGTIDYSPDLTMSPLHTLSLAPDHRFSVKGQFSCADGLTGVFENGEVTDTKFLFGEVALTGQTDATSFSLQGVQANSQKVLFSGGSFVLGGDWNMGNGIIDILGVRSVKESLLQPTNTGYAGTDNQVRMKHLGVERTKISAMECAWLSGSFRLETPPRQEGLRVQFGNKVVDFSTVNAAEYCLNDSLTGLRFGGPVLNTSGELVLGSGMFYAGGEAEAHFSTANHDSESITLPNLTVKNLHGGLQLAVVDGELKVNQPPRTGGCNFQWLGENLEFDSAVFQADGYKANDRLRLKLNHFTFDLPWMGFSNSAITVPYAHFSFMTNGVQVVADGWRSDEADQRWEMDVSAFKLINGLADDNLHINLVYTNAGDLLFDAGGWGFYRGFYVYEMAAGEVYNGLRFPEARLAVNKSDPDYKQLDLADLVWKRQGLEIGSGSTNFTGDYPINYDLGGFRFENNNAIFFNTLTPDHSPAQVRNFEVKGYAYRKAAPGGFMADSITFDAGDLDVEMDGGYMNEDGGITGEARFVSGLANQETKRNIRVDARYDAGGVHVDKGTKLDAFGTVYELVDTDRPPILEENKIIKESALTGDPLYHHPDGVGRFDDGGLIIEGAKAEVDGRNRFDVNEIRMNRLEMHMDSGDLRLAGIPCYVKKGGEGSPVAFQATAPSHMKDEGFFWGLLYHDPEGDNIAPMRFDTTITYNDDKLNVSKLDTKYWFEIPSSYLKLGDFWAEYINENDTIEGETGVYLNVLITKAGFKAYFQLANGGLNKLGFDLVFPPGAQPPVAGVPGCFWKRVSGEMLNIRERLPVEENDKTFVPPLMFKGLLGVSGGPTVKMPVLGRDLPLLYAEGQGFFSVAGDLGLSADLTVLDIIEFAHAHVMVIASGEDKGFEVEGRLGIYIGDFELLNAAVGHIEVYGNDFDVYAVCALVVPAPVPLIGMLQFGEVKVGVKGYHNSKDELKGAKIYGYVLFQLFPCMRICVDVDWWPLPPSCEKYKRWCPPRVRIDWELGIPSWDFDISVRNNPDHPWHRAHNAWVPLEDGGGERLRSLAPDSEVAQKATHFRAMTNWDCTQQFFRENERIRKGVAQKEPTRDGRGETLRMVDEFWTDPLTSGSQYFIRLHFENPEGDGAIQMIDPDGKKYDIATSPWEFGERGRYCYFRENNEARESMILISKALRGKHLIRVLNPETLGDYSIEVLLQNAEPSLSIVSAACDGDTVVVQWEDEDPDDNAKVRLYLTNDPGQPAEGFRISDWIEEDPDGAGDVYSYDLITSPLAAGYYWVKAQYTDDNHAPMYAFSDQPIYVGDVDAPPLVTGVNVIPMEDGLHVIWDKVNDPDIHGYSVLYTDRPDEEGFRYALSAAADQNHAVLTDLVPGTWYRVGVAAVKPYTSSQRTRALKADLLKRWLDLRLQPGRSAKIAKPDTDVVETEMRDLLKDQQTLRAPKSDNLFTTAVLNSLALQGREYLASRQTAIQRRAEKLLPEKDRDRADFRSRADDEEERFVRGPIVEVDTFLYKNPTGNTPPVFSSTPGESGTVGEEYQYLVEAWDPDGDSVRYELAQGPAGMILTEGGMISWTPGEDEAGAYDLEVLAIDGNEASAAQSWQLRIGTQPEAPDPLWIASEPERNVDAGTTWTYHVVTATGDESEEGEEDFVPSISLLDGPAGVYFDHESQSFIWPTHNPEDIGDHRITIKAEMLLADPEADPIVAYQTFLLDVQEFVDRSVFIAPPAWNPTEPIWTAGLSNTLDWSEVDMIDRYEIEIAPNANFDPALDSQFVNAPTQTATFNSLTDGQTYWYRLRAHYTNSLHGNWSDLTSSTQDATAPTGSVSLNGGDSWTNNPDLTLTLTGNDGGPAPSGVDAFRVKDDGSDWGDWQNLAADASWTLSAGDGNRAVSVQFRDLAGNVSTGSISDTILLDTTAPVPTLTASESSPTNQSPILITARFSEDVQNFAAEDVSIQNGVLGEFQQIAADHYQWNLYPAAEGEVTLTVPVESCLDLHDNANAAGSLSLLYDPAAPELQRPVSLLDPNPTHEDTLRFRVDFNEPVLGFTADDLTASGTLKQGVTWALAGDGRHFTATATLPDDDQDGTVNLIIGTGLADEAGNAFAGDGPSRDYQVDHSVPVMLPEPAFTSGTQNTVFWEEGKNATSYTVQMAQTAMFSNLLAESILTSPTTQATFDGLTDGQTYWYRARATNSTGTLSAWAAGVFSTQDDLAPTGTVLIDGGVAFTDGEGVMLNLNAADGGAQPSGVESMRIRNQGDTWTEWQSYTNETTWTLKTTEGIRQVEAQFQDGAGNLSLTVTDNIYLDRTPPTGTVLINNGMAKTGLTTVTLILTATDMGLVDSDVTHMRFSNDGVLWSEWMAFASTINWSLDSVAGEQTVRAAFRDGAGNVSDPAAVDSIVLDLDGPDGEMAFPYGNFRVSQNPLLLGLQFSEPVQGFQKEDLAVVNGTVTASQEIQPGQYQLSIVPLTDGTVRASLPEGVCTDLEGNPNAAVQETQAHYDGTPPVLEGSPVLREAALSCGESFHYQFLFSEEMQDITPDQIRLETDLPVAETTLKGRNGTSYTLTITLSDGDANGTLQPYLTTQIRDVAMNPLAAEIALPMATVNNAAPTLQTEPEWTAGTENTLNWTPVDVAAKWRFQVNDKADFTLPLLDTELEGNLTVYTVSPLTDGEQYYYRLRALDAEGNPGQWSNVVSSTQDSKAPEAFFQIAEGRRYISSAEVQLDITARDSGYLPSGMEAMRFINEGEAWTEWQPFSKNFLWRLPGSDGVKRVYGEFKDKAGNISSTVSDSIELDTTTGPETPDLPFPVHGQRDTALDATFRWGQGDHVEWMHLWLWPAGEEKPEAATVRNLTVPRYQPKTPLAANTAYKWQVEAWNHVASVESPVWQFRTRYSGDLQAIIDHLLGREILRDEEWQRANVNADAVVDVADVITLIENSRGRAATSPTLATAAQGLDLYVESSWGYQTEHPHWMEAQVGFKVRCAGENDSAPCIWRISRDGEVISGGVLPGVKAGGQEIVQYTWLGELNTGPHSFTIEIDVDGKNTEWDETNNSKTYTFDVFYEPLPDLFVQALEWEEPLWDTNAAIEIHYGNQGDQYSGEAAYQAWLGNSQVQAALPPTAPGTSATLQSPAFYYPRPGRQDLHLILDSKNQVVEHREDNNESLTLPVNVELGPRLVALEDQTVSRGDATIAVPLTVLPSQNVAGVNAVVRYDPTVFELAGLVNPQSDRMSVDFFTHSPSTGKVHLVTFVNPSREPMSNQLLWLQLRPLGPVPARAQLFLDLGAISDWQGESGKTVQTRSGWITFTTDSLFWELLE